MVLQSRKKLQVLQKKNFFFQFICADMIFKTVCGIFFFFLRNGSRDTEVLVILRFRKIVFHNKIINKTRLIKNQENSAHHFEDNYHTNNLVKFLQDRIKPWWVGVLLEHPLVITFFKENRSWGVSNLFYLFAWFMSTLKVH